MAELRYLKQKPFHIISLNRSSTCQGSAWGFWPSELGFPMESYLSENRARLQAASRGRMPIKADWTWLLRDSLCSSVLVQMSSKCSVVCCRHAALSTIGY